MLQFVNEDNQLNSASRKILTVDRIRWLKTVPHKSDNNRLLTILQYAAWHLASTYIPNLALLFFHLF